MAESDPRKIRPFGRASERRDFETEEDPLVELARIVSEDRGAQRSRQQREAAPPPEPIQRSPYSADLESELLQELESSFASRPSAKAPPCAPAAPPTQAEDTDQLLRSIEAQLGAAEQRVQPAQPTRPRAGNPEQRPSELRPARPRLHDNIQNEAPSDNPDRRDTDYVATPLPRVEPHQRVPAVAAEPNRGPDTRLQNQGRSEASPRAPVEQPVLHRPVVDPRDVSAEDEDGARLPLRRRDRSDIFPNQPDRPSRGGLSALPAAGWNNVIGSEETGASGESQDWSPSGSADYRNELRTTFGDIDESRGPSRRPYSELETAGADPVDELKPSYSDPSFGAHWDSAESELDGDVSDEPRVAPARPLDSGARAASRRPDRSRKGLLTAAGVLGVLVLGGGVLALMRPGDQAPSGPPPVISAPAGDAKVLAPEQQQAEGETVGEAVYNRVAGAPQAAEEQVVEGAEEPREIARIVLPPPQAESDEALVKPVGDQEVAAAPTGAAVEAAGGEAVAIGPRRVRTYVVRPDGTITASGAAPVTPAAPQPQVAAPAVPIEPVRVATTSINVGEAPAITRSGSPAVAATASPAPVNTAPSANPELSADTQAAPSAAPSGQSGATTAIETETAAPAAPAEAIAPPPASAAPEPAAETADAPTDVASIAPVEPPPVAAAPAAGGYVIQVSSQRSMAEAQSSLAAIKQRYASVVGDLPSHVQQADLGEKGIYFRARVGGWATRAEAIEVCEALQAAGGTCFVTQ